MVINELFATKWLLLALLPVLYSLLVFSYVLYGMRGRRLDIISVKGLGLQLSIRTCEHTRSTDGSVQKGE